MSCTFNVFPWGRSTTKEEHLALIKDLVDVKGANFDNVGRVVLHAAARWGSLDVVRHFVEEKGADVNAVNKEGQTLFHRAADGGNEELVKYLIAAGVSINTKDGKGKTASDIGKGKTASDIARGKGHDDIIEFLEQETKKDACSIYYFSFWNKWKFFCKHRCHKDIAKASKDDEQQDQHAGIQQESEGSKCERQPCHNGNDGSYSGKGKGRRHEHKQIKHNVAHHHCNHHFDLLVGARVSQRSIFSAHGNGFLNICPKRPHQIHHAASIDAFLDQIQRKAKPKQSRNPPVECADSVCQVDIHSNLTQDSHKGTRSRHQAHPKSSSENFSAFLQPCNVVIPRIHVSENEILDHHEKLLLPFQSLGLLIWVTHSYTDGKK